MWSQRVLEDTWKVGENYDMEGMKDVENMQAEEKHGVY